MQRQYFGCGRSVISNRPTIYIVGKHSILNANVEKPTKIERAEVMMILKKRKTRRSNGGDNKDSPDAIAT